MKKIFVLFILSVMFLGPSLIFADDIIPEIEEPIVTLVSIAITSEMEAVKTEYFVGEELDITGLVITGTYSDNTTQVENITLDNITGFDSSTSASNQVLTITVGGKTITYTINIHIVVPPVVENNITIRNGEMIIYSGKIIFPRVEEEIIILDHEVSNQSVLGLLYILDQEEESFLISDISYNESFDSFLLNCITPDASLALCYNWQYVVNGNYSQVGMDKNILEGGENIYLFFGQADRILLNSNSIHAEQDLIVTTEKYDFENNGWLPKQGVVVGVTQVNPDDPFNPIEIQIGQVDEEGQKTFSSIPVGSYSAGIKVVDNGYSYYWPTVNFEVVTSSSDGNNGGGETIPDILFSVPRAISFLLNNQNSDGSFQNDMYTDWVAIASSSTNGGSQLKSKVYNYIINNEFESSIITDHERHIMAMMALGIDPYDANGINYIKKITDSFDGEQIGEKSLINDDIFGLIVLAHAGYTKNDEMIKKITAHIISEQSTNGSWDSIDMTSSAIQALRSFRNLNGAIEAIEKGELYLLSEQNDDGGFGNTSASSWAIQALVLNGSLDEEIEKAILYLTNQQKEDGGLGGGAIASRVWETAYAIPSAMKISWNDLLESFEKEEVEEDSSEEEAEEVLVDDEQQVEEILEKKKEEVKETSDEDANDISSKKQVVDIKDEIKEVITNYELQIINENTLLASAAGAVVGTNESESLFFQKLHNFLNRLISYIKTFRYKLLSVK